jgi:hypothetical protein
MSSDRRRRLSTAMAVLGAALALAGGFALYARAEIFDSDRFADNAVRALGDDRVRDELTEPIVDQAIDRGPDALINAEPVLRAAVSGALDSGPFTNVFRRSVTRLHRSLFSGDGDQLALTIANLDAIVTGAVAAISPKSAKHVPNDLGKRVVEISDEPAVLDAARVGQDVRVLGIVLPVLALLLLGGSVALAPDRRRGLLVAAASTAAAAGIGLIALEIARSYLLSHFEDDSLHAAVEGVWTAYLGGLGTWTLAVGAVALIVAAAAATAREVDAAAPARRAWELAARAPERPGWRLARAAAIAMVSLVALLQPGLALHIVAVVAGAYGLFYAACEVLAMIAPPPEKRRRRTALPRSPQRLALGAGTLAAAVLALAMIARAGGGDEAGAATRPAGPVENCNGYAEICDRPLNEVVFPGTHNAMSAADLPAWYAPNQRHDIRQQLDDGVRAFMIDTHYGVKRPGGGPVYTDLKAEGTNDALDSVRAELGPQAAVAFQQLSANFASRGGASVTHAPYLCHVVCELGSIDLGKALGWFRDFLETHPDEFLILFIEDKVSPADTAQVFEQSGILRYAEVHHDGEPFPTLRETIERDKRLFVMAEKNNGRGAFPWYHQGFALTQETPFTFHSAGELKLPASCDPNRGVAANPLFQVNHWVEKLPRSPRTARKVNAGAFLMERARRCEQARGLLPNIIGVDFYEQGDLTEVAAELNGVPEDTEPSHRTTD